MVRLIVTSRTYQQASTASPELRTQDPLNRALARQSAFRLDAELIRDNALKVSGLLADKIGGPSVKPYQPDGYWENLNFPTREYEPTLTADQYRRASMYGGSVLSCIQACWPSMPPVAKSALRNATDRTCPSRL